MATINTFKEIRSWQGAMELSVECYKLTQEEQFRFEFAMVNQIRKSAISVPSNIAEGFERKGNKEFIQFLFISAGSLGELQTQLILCNKIGLLNEERLQKLEDKSETIKKMVYGMITYLKSSEHKGYKFSEPSAPYGRSSQLNEVSVDALDETLQINGAQIWQEYKRTRGDVYGLEEIELNETLIQRDSQTVNK
jgi:four helix bundle protein